MANSAIVIANRQGRGRDVAEISPKTRFYDVNHKYGGGHLVTPVTDLIATPGKTSNGNVRSSPAMNPFGYLRRR
jgi:hypothetical protein